MANIKFSAFTQKVASADVDFLVGYTGGDNVRITPSVFDDRYLPLAGGTMTGDLRLNDGIELELGNDADIRMYHDDSNGYINSFKGDLYIRTFDNDKDIIFQSDNGSGGTTEYFRVDGSLATGSRVYTVFPDNSTAVFGSGFDFQIYHDSSNTYLQQGGTGDLYIQQNVDDKDIIFQADNGSGGVAEYFRLDGGIVRNVFSKNVGLEDNIKLIIGSGNDLQIYHDGSNSFISDITGTGDLKIQSNRLWFQSSTGEAMGRFTENGSAELYYDNALRLSTTNTGVKITGVNQYADNAAALAGGLTVGDVYRTGDLLKIVN